MNEFNAAIFAWPCVGPSSHALVDYHLERGGMPLHDVVGVNCKRDAATENQGTGAWYRTKGCVFDDSVSVI